VFQVARFTCWVQRRLDVEDVTRPELVEIIQRELLDVCELLHEANATMNAMVTLPNKDSLGVQ
jgi:hypothetical protein